MADPVSSLSAVLASYGLHSGYPAQRRALAESLVTGGYSASDVDLLVSWATDKNPDGWEAQVRKILEDPEELDLRLTDIRFCAGEQSHRLLNRPAFQPNADSRVGPSNPDTWTEQDIARRITARVDSDRQPLLNVARQFDVEEKEAKRLLEVGRKLKREDRDQGSAPA